MKMQKIIVSLCLLLVGANALAGNRLSFTSKLKTRLSDKWSTFKDFKNAPGAYLYHQAETAFKNKWNEKLMDIPDSLEYRTENLKYNLYSSAPFETLKLFKVNRLLRSKRKKMLEESYNFNKKTSPRKFMSRMLWNNIFNPEPFRTTLKEENLLMMKDINKLEGNILQDDNL